MQMVSDTGTDTRKAMTKKLVANASGLAKPASDSAPSRRRGGAWMSSGMRPPRNPQRACNRAWLRHPLADASRRKRVAPLTAAEVLLGAATAVYSDSEEVEGTRLGSISKTIDQLAARNNRGNAVNMSASSEATSL
eukprot:CAMPEP_0170615096 /NCGR_PEP_ID=MMETSP0224-20130122/25151_1 /TAXON_ID=285029 /ORGANISM="Togula jolla, Strain CCCM 725" /LENGTH=135 /DNA_ID=CAMNT_0010940797 /DNA_START=324 /DNA_END=733 /DNA_ORIENTATION=+